MPEEGSALLRHRKASDCVGPNSILAKIRSIRSSGKRSSTKDQKLLAAGSPWTRMDHRATATQVTAAFTTRKAVRHHVRSLPIRLGIFKIHLAIRG